MDSSPSASAVDRPSSVSLRQPWLTVARAIWFIFLAAAVTVTILVVPAIFSAQRNPSDHAIQMGLNQLGLSADVYAAFFVILQLVYAITFIVTAVIIFWRKSDNGLAIFVAVFLVCFGATPSQQFADLARAQPVLGVMVATLAYVGWSCLFPFFYVFPDGHFVPRWTRIATVIAFVQSALWSLPSDSPFHPNHWPPILLAPVLMSLLASVLYAQIYRYRNVSTALQRQQTKWIIFAFAIAAILRLINLVPGFLVPSSAPPIAQVFSEMFYAVASFAFIFIPLVLAVSIFRYRLWDIDFLINRTMVYGLLTACLALIFGVIVYGLSLVTQGQQSTLIVVGGAVVAGALFQPMRKRLQHMVDSRVYHIKIDYQNNPPVSAKPFKSSMTSVLKDTNFGQYKKLELIGRGGMGEVYRAIHPTLNKTIAIKILPAALAMETDFRTRFEREAQTVSQLQHPNIVRVYDSGAVDDTYFMVMEYISGQDLAHYLRSKGRLPLTEIASIVKNIGEALDYAHSQGLVHRDIKPSNIMLEQPNPTGSKSDSTSTDASFDRAVLMDFGIAKLASRSTAVTKSGVLIGTLDYIAPEQIQDSTDVDGRADIYALGIVLYQMLTGELPFKQSNPGALLIAHLTQPAPDPRATVPDLPKRVSEIIQRVLAKQPEQRYQTAGELAQALA